MKKYLPHLAIFLSIAAACVLIPRDADVTVLDEAAVTLDLPRTVGAWQGQMLTFCQNPKCQKEFIVDEVADAKTCPACGGQLSYMTLDEARLLPADTQLRKARYSRATNEYVYLSVVLSGAYRSSIHRPEVCLVGQGNEVMQTTRHAVDLAGRPPLQVTILDMMRRGTRADGSPYAYASYFAYWFAAPGRETPSHYFRMLWMATDRLFQDVSYRWAYIAVAGRRDPSSTHHIAQLDDFLKNLYPMIQVGPAGAPAY